MTELRTNIPFYKDINDFLKSIPSEFVTKNPNFFCLRLKENDGSIHNYKPPFRKDFYFIALVSNAGNTQITYDTINVAKLNSFLVFQSPGLLYSFYRDHSAKGYLIYFKKECLSFFKPDFEKEFPFFNLLHTQFFKFNEAKFQEFAPHFEEVFSSYENSNDAQHKVASIKLLALLYQLKEFTTAFKQWEEGFTTPQQLLLQKFIQLVNNFYIEKRTIEEYASLLHVSPNHLSQSIKSASDKTALSYINERLLAEAKSLIQFTDFDIAEIAYQLNFSDPANFGKFFKKHTGKTPLEYRKQSTNS
ncbi:AraC family transcriptional regulator [Cytophagales bacterium LB-30]|uniref:AraC family transcriptional regulator n=1 Tax=Shiella aurantiaca TaxID=3058365 RepID=A0ABT8F6A6_9BACT|nr:AraC family transcriptional regulator [Shiella aurantiaca]MDN4165905.1 AraC family transcriptional regulator [Shiella aurantiaca]